MAGGWACLRLQQALVWHAWQQAPHTPWPTPCPAARGPAARLQGEKLHSPRGKLLQNEVYNWFPPNSIGEAAACSLVHDCCTLNACFVAPSEFASGVNIKGVLAGGWWLQPGLRGSAVPCLPCRSGRHFVHLQHVQEPGEAAGRKGSAAGCGGSRHDIAGGRGHNSSSGTAAAAAAAGASHCIRQHGFARGFRCAGNCKRGEEAAAGWR